MWYKTREHWLGWIQFSQVTNASSQRQKPWFWGLHFHNGVGLPSELVNYSHMVTFGYSISQSHYGIKFGKIVTITTTILGWPNNNGYGNEGRLMMETKSKQPHVSFIIGHKNNLSFTIWFPKILNFKGSPIKPSVLLTSKRNADMKIKVTTTTIHRHS